MKKKLEDKFNPAVREMQARIDKSEASLNEQMATTAERVEGNARRFNAQLKKLEDKFNPAVQQMQARIDKNEALLYKQMEETAARVESNAHRFDAQLQILETRNKVTALADIAIGRGSLAAYRKLEKLASEGTDALERNAARAELVAVFNAYSIFSPTRVNTVMLKVKWFNSLKNAESDLMPDDIMPKWENISNPIWRARAAKVIHDNVRKGNYKNSYSVASFLVQAMKTEYHLEALRFLGSAFKAVTGCDVSGVSLDQRQYLEWWDENRDAVKEKDSSSVPAALPGSSPSP